jgi:hypothetical protein
MSLVHASAPRLSSTVDWIGILAERAPLPAS